MVARDFFATLMLLIGWILAALSGGFFLMVMLTVALPVLFELPRAFSGITLMAALYTALPFLVGIALIAAGRRFRPRFEEEDVDDTVFD
jgi:predicted membrane protein